MDLELGAHSSVSVQTMSRQDGNRSRAGEEDDSSTSFTSESESDELEETSLLNIRIPRKLSVLVLDDVGSASDVVPMSVDTCEDYWTRLHDIRVSGSLLEYIGRGKSIHDNGLAQSNVPLTPLNHYFEITIRDPGDSCYIAIGLARRDYPLHKHPGWNRGSIAYHADDGKIFIGSGVGTPFGPRCNINDVLGCGIVFPLKYSDPAPGAKSNRWPWEIGDELAPPKARVRLRRRRDRGYNVDNVQDHSSESEDDIWWNNRNQVYEDKVKVFFMRNGKLLGIKEIRIPKGGFYPTVGMMSTNERVLVDLHPLSG